MIDYINPYILRREKNLYRERKTRYLDQMKRFKDGEGKNWVQKNDVKDKGKNISTIYLMKGTRSYQTLTC